MKTLKFTRLKLTLSMIIVVSLPLGACAGSDNGTDFQEVEFKGCTWLVPEHFKFISGEHTDTWNGTLVSDLAKSIVFYNVPVEPLDLPALKRSGEIEHLRTASSEGYDVISYRLGVVSMYKIRSGNTAIDVVEFDEKEFELFASQCLVSDELRWEK